MTKNNSIEFFRFLFICVICLWHFSGYATFVQHGYIAVEFFFIMSGFFLYRSFERHPEIGVLDYILHRVKKFFIPFLISFVLLLLLDRKQYIYPHTEITPDALLDKYFVHIHELFLCQGFSLAGNVPVNYPLWFLSILLFSGGILYSMLQCYRQKSLTLIIPILVLLGYNYLFMNGDHSLSTFGSSFVPGINTSVVRGVAGMGLGILVACLYERKKRPVSLKKMIISVCGVFSLIGFILMILANGNYDYLALFFAPIILLCCDVPNALFQRDF